MAQRSSWGWLIWLIVLAVLAAGGYYGYQYYRSHHEQGPEYKTATIGHGDLTQVVTATGSLNPLVNVQVGSQISGTISKLFVDVNYSVTNGEVIAQIEPAIYLAAVHQAEGDLANSKASLELDDVEAKRAEALYKGNLISQSDRDKAVATFHQAQAQVMMKEASLERSKVDLEHCTIYAPVNGTVISRNVDVGQTVAASFNTPTLFTIANDLAKMQIDAAVSEADIGEVDVKQKVNFTVDAYPTRTFHGDVTQVRNAPTTNQNVITYDTVIGVNNSDLKLKPGMTANVSIVVAERKGALTIPNSALRFHPPEDTSKKGLTTTVSNAVAKASGNAGETNAAPAAGGQREHGGHGDWSGKAGGKKKEHSPMRTVYILETVNGKEEAKPVQIKVGISDGISTEVLEGLKEGDTVITGMNFAGAENAPATSNPFGGPRFR